MLSLIFLVSKATVYLLYKYQENLHRSIKSGTSEIMLMFHDSRYIWRKRTVLGTKVPHSYRTTSIGYVEIELYNGLQEKHVESAETSLQSDSTASIKLNMVFCISSISKIAQIF